MEGSRVPRAILHHWYMCGRKVRFRNEGEVRKFLERKQFPAMYPYECPAGDDGHWHFGHLLAEGDVWGFTGRRRKKAIYRWNVAQR